MKNIIKIILSFIIIFSLFACTRGFYYYSAQYKDFAFIQQDQKIIDLQKSVVLILSGGSASTGIVLSDTEILSVSHGIKDKNDIIIVNPRNKTDLDANINEIKGKLVKIDELADLSLIKLEKPLQNYRIMKFCRDSLPSVGSQIYSIGYPLAAGAFFSKGIVSEYHLNDNDNIIMESDLSINLGESGGAILSKNNISGEFEIVGIIKAVFQGNMSQCIGISSFDIQSFLSSK